MDILPETRERTNQTGSHGGWFDLNCVKFKCALNFEFIFSKEVYI